MPVEDGGLALLIRAAQALTLESSVAVSRYSVEKNSILDKLCLDACKRIEIGILPHNMQNSTKMDKIFKSKS